MSIEIRVEGKRAYAVGNTYAIKDAIKAIGAKWDPDAKAWWVGAAKRAELEAVIAGPAQAAQQAQASLPALSGRMVAVGGTTYGVTSIVFTARDGQRLKLDAAAAAALVAFRQTGPRALEAGGVLLGRWIIERHDVVVDHLTTPMRGDRRSRLAFYRDQVAHQRRIDEAYAASGGTCGYLGEWHTHPEPTPTPSGTDMDDWRRRLRRDHVDVPFVFFAIVGTAEICVWRGARTKAEFEKMEVSDVFDHDPPEDDRRALDEVRGAL